MSSSDDEGEAVPQTVSNYHFVNGKDEPISFSELPVQWNEAEGLDGEREQIFLHGTTDNGLQKIYKQVTTWKFDLSNVNPEISVLSKENNWIKLQKPRKSFEDTIRTILITVHCLHFVKKNPEISERSLWDHLSNVFSLYEARPSENDLIDHTALISEAVRTDETLAKSKFLVTFLEEKPQKKKTHIEDIGTTSMAGFIVEDDIIDEIEEDDGSDEGEEDLFDSVCAICDNGGELLCCEGRCMRSFHATIEAGYESSCESLGYSDEQVEAIQNFFCKNCQYKQHQCFACGELGSSDKLSGAEVFACVSATCGRFYHPHCVAKLLHRESAADAEVLQKKIATGESFTCPIHKCIVCKQGENKMVPDLQFAVCRRCPKAYHRKCLPRKIAFEDLEDEGIVQRAWDGLIPNRILIYCLKHSIDDEIGTPIRNHIKFPDDGQKTEKQASQQLLCRGKVLQKERGLASEDGSRKSTLGKVQKFAGLSSTIREGDSSKKSERRISRPDPSKKQKLVDVSRKPLSRTASTKVRKPTTGEGVASLGERLYALMNKGSDSRKEDAPDSEYQQAPTDKSAGNEISSSLQLDDDSKQRILALMKNASSSITLEEITEKHKVPVTHAYSSKNVVDKAITMGKVEGSVEAIRAALQKLEEGCSIEDAKAVCEPGVLHQIIRWKNKLRVYLSPFLYGMRYTSFGRHFTKVDKLKEIVDVLHYYASDGDMIVDFCCGANDFSWLMKKKLDETGKNCLYKNYDILQAKNDFKFERRDWMSVRPKELPTGSQLIMGLNPPFGVNAALANKFIDKALEFKPKLLILIVPQETERLDKKKNHYDLIWEDDELLAGKSFYLPGSVDVNDNQMEDWNVNPPPLYLWSRPDWTDRHKSIAKQHGHFSRVRQGSHSEDHNKSLISDYPMEDRELNLQTSMSIDAGPLQNEVREEAQERGASVPENHKEGFPSDNHDREVPRNYSCGENQSNKDSENQRHGKRKHGRELDEASQKEAEKGKQGCGKNQSNKGSKNQRLDRGKHGRGLDEASQKDRDKGRHGIGLDEAPKDHERGRSSLVSERYDRFPHRSPANATGSRSPESHSSRPLEAPSHMDVSKESNKHFNRTATGSHSHFRTGHGEAHGDDSARTLRLNGEESYSAVNNNRWPRAASPNPNYGISTADEHFAGYQRESTAASPIPNYGIRNTDEPFAAGYQRENTAASPIPNYGIRNTDEPFAAGYQRSSTDAHGYRSYASEMEDTYARESAMRSRHYGQQFPDSFNQRSPYFAGQDPGFSSSYSYTRSSAANSPYGLMNSSVMNSSSAMQRYAPRLDELNPTRMNTLGGEPPMASRNGIPDPHASQPGYRVDTFGFAPGPYRPFSHQNSSGWLND